MIRIDGNLTDATFRVKSDTINYNDRGGRIFGYCVEAYPKHDYYTINYITGTLVEYSRETYNAKPTDEIFIDVYFNINGKIGDMIE